MDPSSEAGGKYHLASYSADQLGARAGAVIGGMVHDVAALTSNPAYVTVADVLDDWHAAHASIRAAAATPLGTGRPLDSVRLLAPVCRPGAIYCVGSNYVDHADEMRRAGGRPPAPTSTVGSAPFFFIKSSHSVSDPGATVRCSEYTSQPDYEIELVVVIGCQARNLTASEALGCVAGYTVGNDVSARDLRARDHLPAGSLFRADWFRHKSFDNSAPMGPWITPGSFIDDPTNLQLRLWVNGDLRQNSSSSEMIFTAAEQIAHLSSGITLYPGDLIMTGTPAGVGAGRNEFLKAGDVVEMDISQIGRMNFRVA